MRDDDDVGQHARVRVREAAASIPWRGSVAAGTVTRSEALAQVAGEALLDGGSPLAPGRSDGAVPECPGSAVQWRQHLGTPTFRGGVGGGDEDALRGPVPTLPGFDGAVPGDTMEISKQFLCASPCSPFPPPRPAARAAHGTGAAASGAAARAAMIMTPPESDHVAARFLDDGAGDTKVARPRGGATTRGGAGAGSAAAHGGDDSFGTREGDATTHGLAAAASFGLYAPLRIFGAPEAR